jgi:CRP-like cAMP-binding protein
MLSISELQQSYYEIKNKVIGDEIKYDRHFLIFTEFLISKFPETSSIFSKFDQTSIQNFCIESHYEIFEENSPIFKKGEDCNYYYFILLGDINLYENEYNYINESEIGISTQNKLIKTISAGTVYGHKIKNKFNFYSVAKNPTHLIKILKSNFDILIENTNKRKEIFKINFLKKYFPKFRIYSNDILNSLKGYFIREKYKKNSKILIDGEYDEFCYVIIKGEVGVTKLTKKFKNLRENFDIKAKYVIVEKFSRGDVFGIYSALKHQKNNYSVIALSDEVEVYKISKTHCLYYFGGSMGIIPEALKGTDNIQQISIQHKLEHLSHPGITFDEITSFQYIFEHDNEDYTTNKLIIDESVIENYIKDAWKDVENLESKISQFKADLLKGNTRSGGKNIDVFSKMKKEEDNSGCNNKYINMFLVKDHTQIMGFGTTRLVGRTLNKSGLSSIQMKGANTLSSICGVKKPSNASEDKNEYLDKISNIANKIEANPRKNRLVNFDSDVEMKSDEVISTTNPSIEKPAVQKSENKKAKFSLKNLI